MSIRHPLRFAIWSLYATEKNLHKHARAQKHTHTHVYILFKLHCFIWVFNFMLWYKFRDQSTLIQLILTKKICQLEALKVSNHCSYTINFSSLTECFRRHDRISHIINYQETVCLLVIWSEFGFSTRNLESNTL